MKGGAIGPRWRRYLEAEGLVTKIEGGHVI